jgi:hypothetical protein
MALRLFRSAFWRVNWLKEVLGTYCFKSVAPLAPAVGRFGILLPAPYTTDEPLVSVKPRLQVPSLDPQLVSARESMLEWPATPISPRTVSEAGGGNPLKRNWETVAWIFWCAVAALPVLVGT